MKVLHILRSKPSELVRTIIEQGYGQDENVEAPLYEGKLDYEKLIRDLFDADQVISWW